jgi:hypothetical protein
MDMRHDAPPPPKRQPRPGELLFEFEVGAARWRCELRDDGDQGGVDAQFFKGNEFYWSRRWPTRASAVLWAERQRTNLLGAAPGDETLGFGLAGTEP